MSPTLSPVIEALTTHLIVEDAAYASRWYRGAFHATEANRITLPDGRLIHVEMQIGPVTLMLADEFPEHGALAPQVAPTSVLYLHTTDVETLWQSAIDAGAEVLRPLADTFWGEREGQLLDPFGYRWGLTQHLRDVSMADMTAEAARAFG